MHDNLIDSIFTSPKSDVKPTRLLVRAGVIYGLLFGLVLAFFTWGYDTWLLTSANASYPWGKLLLGLPVVFIVGGIVGWISARSSSISVAMLLWAGVGAFGGLMAGRVPYLGRNLEVWLTDQSLWGQPLYVFEPSAQVRTSLVVFISLFIGAAVGFAEIQAIQKAWDQSPDGKKMAAGSWLALISCIPLAFLQAATINEFINKPLRQPQYLVGSLIQQYEAGSYDQRNPEVTSSLRSIEPFADYISGDFTTHFVTFGFSQDWYSGYVDIVFDDGFLLRCVTSGNRIIYCDDFSKKFSDWMGELVYAGQTGEQPWLDARIRLLDVNREALVFLDANAEQFSDTFTVYRQKQHGKWIYMTAEFDSGFAMTCRFSEAAPVVVEFCVKEGQ